MKIFLIGFMGAGKTTQGKRLASLLEYDFTDLDEIIIRKEGMSIPDIFQDKGEDFFREKESLYLQEFENQDNMVISVGGGTPCHHGNMEWMNENGITIYLELAEEILLARLMNSKLERPLLQGKNREEVLEFIKESLAQRETFYKQARLVVPGRNLSTRTLREKISEFMD